jgi:Protein of unknown function (DUF2690)
MRSRPDGAATRISVNGDVANGPSKRPRTRRRLVQTLLATAALGIGSLAVFTGAASAQLVHPYDGTDPAATGCANTAHQAASVAVDGGTLQLMWSTSCHTNWARFTGGNVGSVAVWVYRQADNQWCGDQTGNGCGGQWWTNGAYSNQLFGCNYAELAEVEIWNNGSPIYSTTPLVGGC